MSLPNCGIETETITAQGHLPAVYYGSISRTWSDRNIDKPRTSGGNHSLGKVRGTPKTHAGKTRVVYYICMR